MSLRSWGPGKEVGSPRGMWSVVANRRKGSPSRASFMQNMRIQPGVAVSRPGTSTVQLADDHTTGLFNWLTPSEQNLVLYQDGDQIKSLNQATTALTALYTGTTGNGTRRPSFADLDVWVYFCGYNNTGVGTFPVQVFDGVNVDTAFRAPVILTAATAVDGGAGRCTAGLHYFGVVYTNRTGYTGVPTVDFAGSPIGVTLAAGLRAVNVSVTVPALPDGGVSANGGVTAHMQLIMTRADNPNLWYFVPAVLNTTTINELDVPNNAIATLNFIASISDEDLAAEGSPASNNFRLLAQTAAGLGPFPDGAGGYTQPSFVVAYGQRMVYGVGTTLYASDINNPQQIAADLNAVIMPSQRRLGFAFPLAGSTNLYVTGEFWTSRVDSNSDSPSTWAESVSVSETLGAATPNLVCFKTGGNYAWVITASGPYLFTGTYGERPLTYLCSDIWARVNWSAAYVIECADDVPNLRFYIAVPLDGATECTHLVVIDYTNGLAFNEVDIGLDVFANRPIFSSIGVIKEFATNETNLWIAPASLNSIMHFNPANHYDDGGVAMHCIWKSGLVRGASDFASKMIRLGAADLWVRGDAQILLLTWAGLDGREFVFPRLLSIEGVSAVLISNPGIEYMCKFDLARQENYTFQVETNVAGEWFELSMVRTYAKPDLFNR